MAINNKERATFICIILPSLKIKIYKPKQDKKVYYNKEGK
jgi:hypothetical protein